ncbi:MAG: response regulator [Bacteroidota bacterium]
MSYISNILQKQIDITNQGDRESDQIKLLLLKVYIIAGLILLLYSATINLIAGYTQTIHILIIPFLILLLNLRFFTRKKKYLHQSTNLLITAFLVSSVFFITKLYAGSDSFLWLYLLPLIVLPLKGNRQGSIISVVYLLVIMGLIAAGKNLYAAFPAINGLHLLEAGGFYLLIVGLYFLFEEVSLIHYRHHKNQIDALQTDCKTKDGFISKLSHQIRTPLNNIMVISNLVKESELNDSQKELMETIMASTTTLVNVVNNIVKVTNVEFTSTASSQRNFNLISTIKTSLNILEEQYSEKSTITFNAENKLDEEFVHADPIRIKQIFLNIIENIVDHGLNNEHISITVKMDYVTKSDNHIVVKTTINSDNALPFSKEDITEHNIKPVMTEINPELIIEDIPQCDLTIAKKILKLNNSRLDIKSDGQTTSFSFTLKFVKPGKSSMSQRMVEPGASPKSSPSVNLSDANVLLVEDNLINQKIVILSLKKVVKNIDVANNGKEALDKFGTSKYDIILMDIQMPVMDGIVSTRKIRELEVSSNIQTPIIAITANALAGDKESCLAAGMNDYISKPFQIDVLIQKMRKLVEQPR